MAAGYRSGLEFKTGKIFVDNEIEFEFETDPIPWTPIPRTHKYHPDFRIVTNGTGKRIIIETKGRFMPEDMEKHLSLKAQYPELDIRFVFQGAQKWYRKAKRRTYAKWCEENGFKYCDFKDFERVIKEWMAE